MRKTAFNILRIGVAITFIWVGILILKDPISFSALISPWVLDLLGKFTSDTDAVLNSLMMKSAILDIVIGLLLLANRFVVVTGLVATLHLLSIIATTAILVTVRDIGLAAATLALAVNALPSPFVWPKTRQEWLSLISK